MPIIFCTGFLVAFIASLFKPTDYQSDFLIGELWPMLGLLVFSTAVAHFAFSLSISKVGSLKATAVSYLAILVGYKVDLFYGHQFQITELIGLGLVVYALVSLLKLKALEEVF